MRHFVHELLRRLPDATRTTWARATGTGDEPGDMSHGRLHDALAHVVFGGRRRRVLSRLADLSGIRPGDHALDVGCGTGLLTRMIACRAAPGGHAIGVDPSEEALARARRATRLANCAFQQGRAETLEFPDASYDVVVSSLVIHHLPEEARPEALAEMFRVLRPGGRILIAEFRPPRSAILKRLMGPVMRPAMEHNPLHLLEPMVTAAGFDPTESGDVRPWVHYVLSVKPLSGGQHP